MSEQESIVPLFPIGLVVFPGETLPLHIFEQRYRDLIADIRDAQERGEQMPFGISFSQEKGVRDVGCTVQLIEVTKEYDDGRLDIVTEGERKFHLHEILRDRTYFQGRVSWLEEEEVPRDLKLRDEAIALHLRLVELAKEESAQVQAFEHEENLAYALASQAGMDAEHKQKLLEQSNENKRLQQLIAYYEEVIPNIESSQDVKERIRANGFFRRMFTIEI